MSDSPVNRGFGGIPYHPVSPEEAAARERADRERRQAEREERERTRRRRSDGRPARYPDR